MKLKYLGTAAAEGWPSMFCSCDNCRRARRAGGRNLRTRSQAIVDDRLLIDFPADTYLHILYQGLDLTKINHCLITHDHTDHFYPGDLENRQEGYAYLEKDAPFTLYGPAPTGRILRGAIELYHVNLEEMKRQDRVRYQCVTPYVPFEADGYTVVPLKADHDPLCDPVFYHIRKGGKSILYAHDTGYFPDETWDFLEKNKPRFDLVSLDGTLGLTDLRYGHMGIPAASEVRERLLRIGCADGSTVFCVNHFSHNGGAIYDELLPVAKEHGFLVSYDGMTVEI